ncbi:MAG: YgfZ/GcvT domain-containing protein [Gemmatimonadota bacterium]
MHEDAWGQLRKAWSGADTAVPLSFGDPPAEYTSLTSSAAVVPNPDRVLLRVEGERAAEMLGGLVTNDVAKLSPGHAAYAFLLTPKGRPIADLRVLRLPGELWLDLPGAAADGAKAHFRKYLPPHLATLSPLDDVCRLGIVGPGAEVLVAAFAAGGQVGEPGFDPASLAPLQAAELPLGGGTTATALRREEIEGPGFDLYLPAASLADTWAALTEGARRAGGGPAGQEAYDIWRVERGIPVYGAEISLDVLPQETGQEERAISYTKGCYTGQEVVARIHYRGHVNRHLRGLHFREDRPEAGQRLFAGEREVAAVTSAVRSPRFGPIALGYVRREVEPGAALAATPGGQPGVRVGELPFTET